MKLLESQLRNIVRSILEEGEILSEGMQYHLDHGVGVDKNIYRPGSEKFFELFQEVRRLIKVGRYSPAA